MGHFKMEPSLKSLNKRNQLGPNSISKAHSLEKFKDTSKKCSLSQFGSIFQWSKHQGCIIPLPFPSHFRTSPTVQGERPVVGPFGNNGRGVFGRCGLCLSPCLGLIRHPLSRCSNFWPASRAQVHRHAHNFREVQQCTLLSVKTGGCSEDCSYCPQSSRYSTGVKAQRLMNKDAVLQAAQKAKEAGSTRFCMGAAWRDTVGRKTNFNQILEYVKEIR
ncbi:Biotin synthase, mitochondrial [Vitis vinifera]|uniref:Biotin synthase, mitochondrial n=1 Tax=Vitis vinifera TaxID=29760 RepID=A0A438GX86_VITVI|nr:Biotin synthase, mitochondrial [Vitis vinifera]